MLDTDPTTEPTDRTDELIAELSDRVRSLADQLSQERDANRENRRIIAALTSRIPELEAAPADNATDAPGSPVSGGEGGGNVPYHPNHRAAQSPGPGGGGYSVDEKGFGVT